MPPTIDAGMKLGPYEIISPLGAGGMGEVYRARDTQLNREVAIKVLPRAFAEDPNRMARFEREAQLLASLNHPGIAAIYGLEESGATRALVMELVDGPTLAERIGRAAASARASAHPGAGSASPALASGGAGSGAMEHLCSFAGRAALSGDYPSGPGEAGADHGGGELAGAAEEPRRQVNVCRTQLSPAPGGEQLCRRRARSATYRKFPLAFSVLTGLGGYALNV
jgi:hypothetical protein